MKAFGIFSGGLDSLLAARILMDQGITPTLLTFTSPFFDPGPARSGAAQLGLDLTLVSIYEGLLPLIKNPPHGRGRHLNPCIDCHALMLRLAGELLDASGETGFVFSGEVLGQRPMSQNPRALQIVATSSGQKARLLRPLSAKILPPTEAEIRGWVDRERLLGLSGRGRRTQLDLAAAYGLTAPPPAGGCLLTDEGYTRRFRWLLDQAPAGLGSDDPAWPPARLAEMLKRGRLFSAEPGQWLMVGRNQADNQVLASLVQEGDTLFHLDGAPGPTVLAPGPAAPSGRLVGLGRSLAAAYGDHGGAPEVMVRMETVGRPPIRELTAVTRPAAWESLLVK